MHTFAYILYFINNDQHSTSKVICKLFVLNFSTRIVLSMKGWFMHSCYKDLKRSYRL